MIRLTRKPAMCHRLVFLTLLLALPSFGERGKEIYFEHCASCHGDRGEGVADEYDEALVGKKSIDSLSRYIHKSMPEDDEDSVIDKDAELVAAYIHREFYSPEAQAKIKPVRRDLLRRTQHQHRHALADLVTEFRWRPNLKGPNGLKAHYFNKEKMNNRKDKRVERRDDVVSFDINSDHGVEKLNPKAFSIYWAGSLLPPETGLYHFRIKTPNGARLHLNQISDKEEPFLDGWVSSANQMRKIEGSIFLLGGHAVPLMLDYVSYKEKNSSIVLEWKPPHSTWQLVPTKYFFPQVTPAIAVASTPFPADDASLGYERGSSISKAWKSAVTNAALEITSHVYGDIESLAKTKTEQDDYGEKLRKFCFSFATNAFGRPLTKSQKNLYVESLFAKHSDDPDAALKRSLMLTLTSPYFLYPGLNLDDKGQPDKHTLAAHLALLIWDSVPDQRLRDAAKHGRLDKPEGVAQVARELLDDPRAREKMNRFFFQWLHLSEKEDLMKDPKSFPGFDEGVIADLRNSFSQFTSDVVWSGESDYRNLFRSPELPMTPKLEKIYEPGENQAGILTHPYLLTAFAYHKQSSPIHRGVYLSRNVLGRYLKPPPQAIEFKDSDFKPDLTMREKVTELTKDENCMVCHSIINPVGFSLENYDAIGRFRTKEQNKPINTTSDYPTTSDGKIRISGPKDLARLAIDHPEAHQAFIKHLFHHLVQQPVQAYGLDQMDRLHKKFVESQFNIRRLIEEVAILTLPN